ncbi:MAG: cytochrome b/b6 domain-containing protein [Ignavibacteria bacterium]|nr:cytochrome b/b6 domain-containing protein [Ignavibacteria bacterium]
MPMHLSRLRRVFPFSIAISLVLVLAAPVLRSQTKEDCLACHSDKSLTMDRNGKTIPLHVKPEALDRSPHRKLSCVGCHSGFDAGNIPHKEKIAPVKCSSCHKTAELKHPFHAKMLGIARKAGKLDAACKDCHGRHDVVSPKVPGSKFSAANIVNACKECHSDVADHFATSAHGLALASGAKGAPTCIGCHKQSITFPSVGADTAKVKLAQERICLSCHLDNPDVRERTGMSRGFVQAYDKSVHGAALQRGNGKAATCVDCHGSHNMMKSLNPASQTNKAHIPEVCAKCHGAIATEYGSSIHGSSLAKGNKDAPACTDCHGEHSILAPSNPNSPVAPGNVSQKICTPCHSSVKLSEKYGLTANKGKTYEASYHGLALRGGSAVVANCGSCHGVHNIKPSADPTSMVNKANLVHTCGKCHPGANEAFTVGSIHVTMGEKDEPILYWIATLYLILIGAIIGGMALHNIADFRKKAKRKLAIRRGEIPAPHPPAHRLHVRMTLNERIQHASLFSSFFLLVITGFMLRFPDAWWVVAIRGISDSAFELRSLVHRIAGVVMILASLYHVGYVTMTPRGRRLIIDLLPRWQDAKDAVGVLKYNFGFSKVKPLFDRFSYIEKSEYWALVWGNIIMGATGFIMWFDNYFMGIFTKLGWDIARTVHYYEAWLAFLAIVVWHFYFVIFNPDSYPMNLAWFKGTLSEEEMEEEHPLELERIKEAENTVDISDAALRNAADDTPTV